MYKVLARVMTAVVSAHKYVTFLLTDLFGVPEVAETNLYFVRGWKLKYKLKHHSYYLIVPIACYCYFQITFGTISLTLSVPALGGWQTGASPWGTKAWRRHLTSKIFKNCSNHYYNFDIPAQIPPGILNKRISNFEPTYTLGGNIT